MPHPVIIPRVNVSFCNPKGFLCLDNDNVDTIFVCIFFLNFWWRIHFIHSLGNDENGFYLVPHPVIIPRVDVSYCNPKGFLCLDNDNVDTIFVCIFFLNFWWRIHFIHSLGNDENGFYLVPHPVIIPRVDVSYCNPKGFLCLDNDNVDTIFVCIFFLNFWWRIHFIHSLGNDENGFYLVPHPVIIPRVDVSYCNPKGFLCLDNDNVDTIFVCIFFLNFWWRIHFIHSLGNDENGFYLVPHPVIIPRVDVSYCNPKGFLCLDNDNVDTIFVCIFFLNFWWRIHFIHSLGNDENGFYLVPHPVIIPRVDVSYCNPKGFLCLDNDNVDTIFVCKFFFKFLMTYSFYPLVG